MIQDTDTATTIRIASMSDAFEARFAAREEAYKAGFSLEDQAYVALAAWTMTIALGLGVAHQGDISIGQYEQGERQGIRILCLVKGKIDFDAIDQTELRSLVDELDMLPSKKANDTTQVVAVVWNKGSVKRESSP